MYLSRLTWPPPSGPLLPDADLNRARVSCDRAFNFSFDKQQFRFHISFERATWSVNNEISSGFGEEWILTQFPSEIWFFTRNLRNSYRVPPPLSIDRPSVLSLFVRENTDLYIYIRVINSKSISTLGKWKCFPIPSIRMIGFEKSFLIFTSGRGGDKWTVETAGSFYHVVVFAIVILEGSRIRKLRLLRKKYRETIESMNWSTE